MAKWHFLFRDPTLTAYEKLVGAAYAGRQRKDNWLAINKEVIACDCAISVRQVERCKKSLEQLGILLRKVERAPSGDMVTLYRIVQRQGSLFERKAKKPPGATVSRATISRIYPEGQILEKQKPASRKCVPKELEDRKKIERRDRRERIEVEVVVKQNKVAAEAYVGMAPDPADFGVLVNPAALERIRQRELERQRA